VYVLVVAVVFTVQRKLIYLPSASLHLAREEALPEAKDVVLTTADGLRLGAWLVEGPPGEGPRTAILVFDGNAGDRSLRAPLARALAATGASVLLFDYRGYGGNPGAPSEEGLRADARAARDYVDRLPGHGDARIVYFGESLGTAVALALATERPPDALILRSPFPALADVAAVHYPYLPVRLLLRDRFDCLAAARALPCPALVLAGSADRVIPERLSRELLEALAGPKCYVQVPGADHNDPDLFTGPAVIEGIRAFLAAD
jgi:fermentation-respiration switch protein FrsA (DUF1100 family)